MLEFIMSRLVNVNKKKKKLGVVLRSVMWEYHRLITGADGTKGNIELRVLSSAKSQV